jgi:nitrogen regulatory protein P-II 1
MTKIEVLVRPSRLDALKQALDHAWIAGLTVSEVKGCRPEGAGTAVFRGGEYRLDLEPRLKVELVVPAPLVPRVLHDLQRSLRTGKPGDGKVFVTPVLEAVRVRTGERGEDAL